MNYKNIFKKLVENTRGGTVEIISVIFLSATINIITGFISYRPTWFSLPFFLIGATLLLVPSIKTYFLGRSLAHIYDLAKEQFNMDKSKTLDDTYYGLAFESGERYEENLKRVKKSIISLLIAILIILSGLVLDRI